jgi:arginyl-tRNA--protein-N-Asp/Glu arginylyltransferase
VRRAVGLPIYSHYPAVPPPMAVKLITTPPHPCSYFPERLATIRAFAVGRMDGAIYQQFMDAAFRRSGRVIYQPACGACRRCIPIRVPTDSFKANKSQRRCWKRNSDLIVDVCENGYTDEKFALYQRYQSQRHGKGEPEDSASFVDFLCQSPVKTVDCMYRDSQGRLLAVGVCDVTASALSSVYFYFEPAESRRGLGTFGALWELDYAARNGLPYYYLGFWVRESAKMRYKTNYRPFELLHSDGIWRNEKNSLDLIGWDGLSCG